MYNATTVDELNIIAHHAIQHIYKNKTSIDRTKLAYIGSIICMDFWNYQQYSL